MLTEQQTVIDGTAEGATEGSTDGEYVGAALGLNDGASLAPDTNEVIVLPLVQVTVACASALPFKVALVSSVTLVCAKIVPRAEALDPISNVVPTCQKTLLGRIPPAKTTCVEADVRTEVVAWKMITSVGEPDK